MVDRYNIYILNIYIYILNIYIYILNIYIYMYIYMTNLVRIPT